MARLEGIYDRDKLPEDKRHIHDYLVETRGRVSEGFGPLMYSPEAAYRIAQLGTFVRFESSLTQRMKEVAALTASSELGNPYEGTIHAKAAADLGIAPAVIEGMKSGRDVSGAEDEDAFIIRCAREITRDHTLSEATFAEARKRYGDAGAIDLVASISYYSMLAYIHQSLGIAPPA